MYESKAYEEANVFPGEYYINRSNGICYKILSKKELDITGRKHCDYDKYIYYIYGKNKDFIDSVYPLYNIAGRTVKDFEGFVKIASSPSAEVKMNKCPKCGGKMEYVNMAEKCENCWWVKQ